MSDFGQHSEIQAGKPKAIVSKVVLEYLALGGILAAAVAAPYLLVAAAPIALELKKQRRISKQQIRSSFYYLRRQGYIAVESKRGLVSVSLTKRGKQRARKGIIELMPSLPKQTSWDGRWRIIMFDIRADQKIARDALRHLLRRIGFVSLQKSVWVYPHECKKVFDFLSQFFELDQGALRYITATDIGSDRALRRHFRL